MFLDLPTNNVSCSCFLRVKPFASTGYDLNKASLSELGPPWQGRSIAGPKLRLVEFSAFLEQRTETESAVGCKHLPSPYSEFSSTSWRAIVFSITSIYSSISVRRPPTQILLSRYNSKLIIFHRGTSFNQSNLLQAIDVRQIYDKFPESKGGLKDLYDKGPSGAFFLVKFWVSCHVSCVTRKGSKLKSTFLFRLI